MKGKHKKVMKMPPAHPGMDTEPAMLRVGEFVLRPEAVKLAKRLFGKHFLEKLNQGEISETLLHHLKMMGKDDPDKPKHYAIGGEVSDDDEIPPLLKESPQPKSTMHELTPGLGGFRAPIIASSMPSDLGRGIAQETSKLASELGFGNGVLSLAGGGQVTENANANGYGVRHFALGGEVDPIEEYRPLIEGQRIAASGGQAASPTRLETPIGPPSGPRFTGQSPSMTGLRSSPSPDAISYGERMARRVNVPESMGPRMARQDLFNAVRRSQAPQASPSGMSRIGGTVGGAALAAGILPDVLETGALYAGSQGKGLQDIVDINALHRAGNITAEQAMALARDPNVPSEFLRGLTRTQFGGMPTAREAASLVPTAREAASLVPPAPVVPQPPIAAIGGPATESSRTIGARTIPTIGQEELRGFTGRILAGNEPGQIRLQPSEPGGRFAAGLYTLAGQPQAVVSSLPAQSDQSRLSVGGLSNRMAGGQEAATTSGRYVALPSGTRAVYDASGNLIAKAYLPTLAGQQGVSRPLEEEEQSRGLEILKARLERERPESQAAQLRTDLVRRAIAGDREAIDALGRLEGRGASEKDFLKVPIPTGEVDEKGELIRDINGQPLTREAFWNWRTNELIDPAQLANRRSPRGQVEDEATERANAIRAVNMGRLSKEQANQILMRLGYREIP